MKKYMWVKTFAAGLIAMAVIAGSVENAEAQKFRFRDLFKKTKATSTTKKSEAPPAEEAKEVEKKAEPDKEKPEPVQKEAVTTAKVAPSASKPSKPSKPFKPSKTMTSKPKVISTADRLKSLTEKLNKAESDPGTLLRSARDRFMKLKAKESQAKKDSVAVARPTGTEKKAVTLKETPKVEKKAVAIAESPPLVAPVNAAAKPTVSGAGTSTPKAAVSSRPPSLVSVTAVAAAPAVTPKEAPTENLQKSLAASTVPPPKPLVPVKEKKKKKSAADVMEITSDEVEMDNAKRTTAFIGNVILEHPTFHLESDRLLIYMNDVNGASEAPFKQAVATGAKVIVKRLNDKGGEDVGQSRKAVYSAHTGDLVLSGGPAQLQSGERLVKTSSDDATITLKKDGNHSVKDRSTKGGNTVVIPIKGTPGGGPSKGPSLLPGKFDDISTRKK